MDNATIEREVIREKIMTGMQTQSNEELYWVEQQGTLPSMRARVDDLMRCVKVTVDPTVATKKKGLLGKLVVLFKRFSRKVVAWYLQPVCDRQTKYNHRVYESMCDLLQWQKKMETLMQEQQLKMQEQQLKMQEQQLKMQEQKLKIQEQEVNVRNLSHKYDTLEKRMMTLKHEMFWDKHTTSQSGEDSIILYILMVLGIDLSEEYYLDLGANHAKELSNTYVLYERGMRGVLVEANPALIPELEYMRKGDIVLNRCIAMEKGVKLPFYILNGDGLSSPDWSSIEDAMNKNPNLVLEKTIEVDSITISEILKDYFDKPPLVMNIDIEGMEKEIIEAIDFENAAPLIIVVERIDYNTQLVLDKRDDGMEELMKSKGYVEYAFTGINSIYLNKKMLEEYQK